MRVFNPQNVAQIVDDGRTVGSGEWADVNDDSNLVRQLINDGRLIETAPPTAPEEQLLEPYLGEGTKDPVKKTARTKSTRTS